jgi:Adenylyl/Guanylyl and SMODS C-terminal sensor domain
MFDLSAELQTFYDTNVRLGVDRRKRLADHRDLNITRLKGGLDDLAADTGRARPHPYDWQNQGGYAMHTLNQDPHDDNDYDIDVAVLFNKADLPDDPLKARQRVADALGKRCTNFTQEPIARTNAVTVWYAEGHHVDFAVFRTYTDVYGRKIMEHASTEWKERDPQAVNKWFQTAVETKSPPASLLVTVGTGQLRRIVRFMKWFSKSRTSWSLPGGLIISTLVAESYRPDFNRDDVALYNTIVAMRNRLNGNTTIHNQVDGSEFTSNPEILNQVKRLNIQLGMAVTKLATLFNANCDRTRARGAWDWIFVHDFWGGKELAKAALDEAFSSTLPSAHHVTIRCDLAKGKGGRIYVQYYGSILPKDIDLRFSVVSTNVPRPYLTVWHVENHGDEARECNQLTYETAPSESYEHWTSTAYKGSHRMICRIMKDGRVWAETSQDVKIAPGKSRWLRRKS